MANSCQLFCSLTIVVLSILVTHHWRRGGNDTESDEDTSESDTSPAVAMRRLESADCFRAAVYEHHPKGDDDHHHQTPRRVVDMNLEHFFVAIKSASRLGANMIVLPEDSLLNSEKFTRKVLIEQVLEEMPEPEDDKVVLCKSNEWPKDSVLKRISCSAIENRIWIAFSFGDKVRCKKADTHCPADGHYLYNTIALFNDEGVVVTKYHKMQLYYEYQYNIPSDCETHTDPVVYYDSPFGRLGFAVCFDSLFKRPILESVFKYNIDTLIYSTYWFNYWPFNIAVQMHQSVALALRINFLGANVHNPAHGNFGSGIYSANKGTVVHTNVPDGVSRLLVANLPKRYNSTAKCVRQARVEKVWSLKTTPVNEEMHMDPKMFQLTKLINKQDMIEACAPGTKTCCSLFYRVKDAKSLRANHFHMIVGSGLGPGLNAKHYQINQEFCGVAACKDPECKEYSRTSSTIFTAINLKAKFDSEIVYPSVMLNRGKLLEKRDWSFYRKGTLSVTPDWSMITVSLVREPILLATLYGRLYDKEPPYKH